MIYWAPFLHFYQPPIQFSSMLKQIARESYRPLTEMFLRIPSAKVTININGVLTEMLAEHGETNIINNFNKLAKRNQLEFVESGKYHPILPLIPKREVIRQIDMNHESNKRFFQKTYRPRGLFPPEMCYSDKIASLVSKLGYDWMVLSGIACRDQWPVDHISSISFKKSAIRIFFRDDILSNKVSFNQLDYLGFIKELVWLSKNKKDTYIITAMDAETFGHHIKNLIPNFLIKVYKTIEELYRSKGRITRKPLSHMAGKVKRALQSEFGHVPLVKTVTISELIDIFPTKRTKSPRASSWSTTKEDMDSKNYYPLWKGHNNDIHALQWRHMDITGAIVRHAMNLSKNEESKRYSKNARDLLDQALHSCQFWWANKDRGLWSIGLINKGLILQEEAIINARRSLAASNPDKRTNDILNDRIKASRDCANQIRDRIVVK